jgi:tRNA(Ile2) C34 agmatinyltransferase TiaS
MVTRTRYVVLVNKAKCGVCGDVIESKHRHDYVRCSCGEIAVDGGKDYLKRSANNFDNLIEMSEGYTEEYESEF